MEKDYVNYNQPTPNPTPKLAAAGIAGSITVVLVYLVQVVFKVEIPSEVASALTAIMAFGAGYIKQDAKPIEAVRIIEGEK